MVFVEYVSAFGFGRFVLECSIADFGDVSSGNINFSASRDGVHLIDALERHSIYAEGSADEKETRFELLEENNPSTSVATGGKDEHAAILDAFAQLGGTRLLSTGLTLLVLSWVPIELLDH